LCQEGLQKVATALTTKIAKTSQSNLRQCQVNAPSFNTLISQTTQPIITKSPKKNNLSRLAPCQEMLIKNKGKIKKVRINTQLITRSGQEIFEARFKKWEVVFVAINLKLL